MQAARSVTRRVGAEASTLRSSKKSSAASTAHARASSRSTVTASVARKQQQQQQPQEPIGITPSSIRRLARRAGVSKVTADVYEALADLYDRFVRELTVSAAIYARHARRDAISIDDMRAVLREHRSTVYA